MSNKIHDPFAPESGAGRKAHEQPAEIPEPNVHATEYGPQGVVGGDPQQGVAEGGPTEAPEVAPAADSAALKALEAQVADLKDQVLRAFAETENVRKRGERERLDTQKYAVSKFARDVISIADNLERAVAAAPAEAADAALKGLLDGVIVTQRALTGVLERHGIKRIEALGGPFDPHQHQAVMEQPDPSVPNGTVVRVFEAGYTIEDRVLRPASVVVAKGGPPRAKAPPQDAAATTESVAEASNDNGMDGASGDPSGNA
jgi:molecular chaperone GrpE